MGATDFAWFLLLILVATIIFDTSVNYMLGTENYYLLDRVAECCGKIADFINKCWIGFLNSTASYIPSAPEIHVPEYIIYGIKAVLRFIIGAISLYCAMIIFMLAVKVFILNPMKVKVISRGLLSGLFFLHLVVLTPIIAVCGLIYSTFGYDLIAGILVTVNLLVALAYYSYIWLGDSPA